MAKTHNHLPPDVERNSYTAGRRAGLHVEGLASTCPDRPECQSCPAASEDDVCLPHERTLRELYEAALPFFDKADNFSKVTGDEIMRLGVALHEASSPS